MGKSIHNIIIQLYIEGCLIKANLVKFILII